MNNGLKLDEFFNVKEATGNRFTDLPYDLRVDFHHYLTNEEMVEFRRGDMSAEVFKKVQSVYNNWHKNTYPSEEDLLDRRLKARKESDMENLNRTLKRNKEQLAKLDKMVENDMPVKAGERVRLRQEILQLEAQLSVHNSIATTSEPSDSTEQDWVDKVLL